MRSKFYVCRILEMMHNFVRSANCMMKQIKLSNCTSILLVVVILFKVIRYATQMLNNF